MGILTQPELWIDGFDGSPPFQYEAIEEDDRWWWSNSSGSLNSQGPVTFTGYEDAPSIDDLPASIVFVWEIVVAPSQGNAYFYYYTGDGEDDTRIDIGSVIGTGSITLTPDETWFTSEDSAFYWGIGTYENVTAPYAYGAIVAVGEGDAAPAGVNCDCADERTDRTLLELRTSLLRRLGFSAQADNPPPGMEALLDDFLRDAQNQLYHRYSSLRTERFFRWTMTPGTRFYGIRADEQEGECDLSLDPYRITWAGIEDLNEAWMPLLCGIPPTLYTTIAQRGLPYRYEVRQCIEVYPAPDAAYVLRVKGHFGLQPFTDDAHQTTIDSEAVFLLALAQAKAHYGQPDAGNYFGQANSYIGALVAGSHLTRRYVPNARERPVLTQPRLLSWDNDV